MTKKIALLTVGHPPFDERIYWKFGSSISSNGYDTMIFCSTENINTQKDNISITGFKDDSLKRKAKLNKLFFLIDKFKPDLIICFEASAIIPAYKYKKSTNNKCKIVSDITEWYPENVAFKKKGLKRYLSYIILFAANFLLVNRCDFIIVGEKFKLRRYKLLAPFTPKAIIGYYPVLKFFKYSMPQKGQKAFTICYAGLINFERGIKMVVEAADKFAKLHKEIMVKLKVFGKFQLAEEENKFNLLLKERKDINIERIDWTSYDNISDNLSDVHLCLDLRKRNFIYNNSLPIKIFEYMACGKPFIYSDIKPIKRELNVNDFGVLVNPDNLEEIIKAIEKYYSDYELLIKHSQNSRKEIECCKNWETESRKLINIIRNLI
jgi:glycosyltransferase involved in cell wall biosynthesis